MKSNEMKFIEIKPTKRGVKRKQLYCIQLQQISTKEYFTIHVKLEKDPTPKQIITYFNNDGFKFTLDDVYIYFHDVKECEIILDHIKELKK